jgi:ankyrin repeat protein
MMSFVAYGESYEQRFETSCERFAMSAVHGVRTPLITDVASLDAFELAIESFRGKYLLYATGESADALFALLLDHALEVAEAVRHVALNSWHEFAEAVYFVAVVAVDATARPEQLTFDSRRLVNREAKFILRRTVDAIGTSDNGESILAHLNRFTASGVFALEVAPLHAHMQHLRLPAWPPGELREVAADLMRGVPLSTVVDVFLPEPSHDFRGSDFAVFVAWLRRMPELACVYLAASNITEEQLRQLAALRDKRCTQLRFVVLRSKNSLSLAEQRALEAECDSVFVFPDGEREPATRRVLERRAAYRAFRFGAARAQSSPDLHTAVRMGDSDGVESLVAAGASLYQCGTGLSDGDVFDVALRCGRQDLLAGATSDVDELLAAIRASDDARVRQAVLAGVLKHAAADCEPLRLACALGRTAIVTLLLEGGANHEARDEHGWTPLMAAAHHADVLRVLLQRVNQSDLNQRANDGRTTALLLAVAHDSSGQCAQLLLDAGGDGFGATVLGTTVLSLAVRAGSMALVQRLLTLPHVDANAADLRGRTALMLLALKGGDATTCAALLRSGAQAAQLAHGGVGALLLACQEGHAAMAELLLDGGADVNSRTSDEHALTPLVMAVLRRRTACVALLLRRGADLNVVWQRGMSVLGVAVRTGCAESVRQLLAAKASADGSGIGEDAVVSPLVAASGCGNRELVDALLEAGADVDNTALHNAARGGFVGVVRTLLAFGAAVDWASPCAHPRVHTPLHYAVSGGHADVVAVLLAHGADRRLIDIDDSVSASVRAALATTVPHPRGGWLVEEVRGRLPQEQEKEKTEDDRRRREHDKNARETVLSQLRAELARPSPPRQPLPAALSSSDQSMLSKSADSDDDDHDQASGIGYDAEDCDTTSSDSSATSKGPWSKLFGHAHTHLIETH